LKGIRYKGMVTQFFVNMINLNDNNVRTLGPYWKNLKNQKVVLDLNGVEIKSRNPNNWIGIMFKLWHSSK
jgi:hypothetical protein